MSASKVAAVVGLSPYESRFSLYYRMAGRISQPEQNTVMARGHYLESAVAEWWADQHPEYDVLRGQSFLHETRDWQIAAPDRLLALKTDAEVTSVLEVKTAADEDEWGPAGSDQIPIGYRCQVLWQMATLGVGTAHVAVLLPYLEFREYLITYDAEDADFLVAEAAAFMDSLPGGTSPQRPDIDAHDATYKAVKQLADGVIDEPVEIDRDLADRYLAALPAAKAANAEKQLATSLVLDAIGNYTRAVCGGQRIATRAIAKATGATNSLRTARTHTVIEEIAS